MSIQFIKRGGGGGGFPPDWTEIGYEETPLYVIDDFNYAKDIKDNWDSSITSMYKKYESDSQLTIFPLVDTSNVTTMNRAFYYCMNLKNIPLLDTSNVTNFETAFFNCTSLKEIPFFNTSKVTTMYQAFYRCRLIETVPSFDTSKVTTFYGCFDGCSNLKNVPILDMSSISSTGHLQMFSGCDALTDESLNNILQTCINATRISSSYRTLQNLGINNTTVYPVSRIEALSNYQAFINAGWTIGY